MLARSARWERKRNRTSTSKLFGKDLSHNPMLVSRLTYSLRLALCAFALGTPASTYLWAGSTSIYQNERFTKLPLSFEINQGQTDKTVRFLSRGAGFTLFLTDSEMVLAHGPGVSTPMRNETVRMQLIGANREPRVTGFAPLPGITNYFVRSDPSSWHVNIPTFAKVRYDTVYPGIDLVYYGNQQRLEYDFVLAPHADPDQIRLHFTGVREVSLTSSGDLLVSTREAALAFKSPVAYQELDGKRNTVSSRFRLLGKNTIGFVVGGYDRSKALVIDPTLAYSTYLGGSGGQFGDIGKGIATDNSGNVYVTGSTGSTDFPLTPGAYQPSNKAAAHPAPTAFLSKIDPSGPTLVYSTYFGGSGRFEVGEGDSGNAVAVDPLGNAYVGGVTYSTDFPITSSAFQKTIRGASNGFVTRFSADGSTLVYSTYLGGTSNGKDFFTQDDGVSAIAVDAAGNAYVTGLAYSTDFPVTNGVFQPVNKAVKTGNATAFVTKLDPTGTSLVYSTYLGGTGNGSTAYEFYSNYGDAGQGIAIDAAGNAYVTGYTFSPDFPVTPGALQPVNNGNGASTSNVFITKLNPTGSGLVYSTYLGGTGAALVNYADADVGQAIAVDSQGQAYVTGYAYSTDFPTTKGAFQTTNNASDRGCANAFVSEIDPLGQSLVYSTYLGGGSNGFNLNIVTQGNAIAVDAAGHAIVAGQTLAANFPVSPNAYQQTKKFASNVFITEMTIGGDNLVYSSFLGGNGNPYKGRGDYGTAVALDLYGNAWITGGAYSADFPLTSGALQTKNKAYATSTNVFVAAFSLGAVPQSCATTTNVTADKNPQATAANITFTATVQPNSCAGIPTGLVIFSVDGTPVSTFPLSLAGRAAYSTSSLNAGQHSISAAYTGDQTFSASSGSLLETVFGPVQVSFSTSPAALTYSVDGSLFNTSRTTALVWGSQHTISVPSPQISGGAENTFGSWSDGGAQSHLITINSTTGVATYNASFQTAYLLTTSVSPAGGGTITPASGVYYPAGSTITLSATPQSGYTFTSWTGNVTSATTPATNIIMNAPQSVTANFASSSSALYGNIDGKNGPSSARTWLIQVGNSGPGVALASQVSGVTLLQVSGASCSPNITSLFPATAGDLQAGASATIPVTLNFSSCPINARFTVTVALSANAGGSTASVVRLNQFQ